MGWRIFKSVAVGIGVACLWVVLSFAAETFVVDHFVHPTLPCPQPAAAPTTPSSTMIATTTETVCDEFTWDDVIVGPTALGALLLGSVWSFRRSGRRYETTSV